MQQAKHAHPPDLAISEDGGPTIRIPAATIRCTLETLRFSIARLLSATKAAELGPPFEHANTGAAYNLWA
jgi:hypothetical protein